MAEPSYPTTRVLALLELLESHGRLSGPELARRLGVGERTVRRYMTLLDEIGIPVEAERGRNGSYHLRPGYKIPPLMFTEDEALALVVSLMAAKRQGVAGPPDDAERALAKVERVLPDHLRARMDAVQQAVTLARPRRGAQPEGAILTALSEAMRQCRSIRLRYRSSTGEQTARTVDIYGLVALEDVWYAAGYDHLRAEMRTFRIDRIRTALLREDIFTPPEHFDALAYVEHALASTPGAWRTEILLETTLEEAQRLVPAIHATLEPTAHGIVARGYAKDRNDLALLAHTLAGMRTPLIVLQPPELREELSALATYTASLAEREPPASGPV